MTPAQTIALSTLILATQTEAPCAIARPREAVIRGTLRRIDFQGGQVHVSADAELWIDLDEMIDMVAERRAFILSDEGRPMRLTLA